MEHLLCVITSLNFRRAKRITTGTECYWKLARRKQIPSEKGKKDIFRSMGIYFRPIGFYSRPIKLWIFIILGHFLSAFKADFF